MNTHSSTPSVCDTFHRALAAQDALAVERAFKEHGATEDQLAAVLSHSDPLMIHAGLVVLQGKDLDVHGLAVVQSWAALLPASLAGLLPESQKILARLTRRFHRWHPSGALPDWRSEDLLDAVALEWLETQCVTDPERWSELPRDESFYQVLQNTTFASLPYPDKTVLSLAKVEDPPVQERVLMWVEEGLGQALMSPSMAHSVLVRLCSEPAAWVKRRALKMMAEPWVRSRGIPENAVMDAFTDEGEGVAAAALEVLVAHGHWRSLAWVLTQQCSVAHRQKVVGVLGRVGPAELIDDLLDLALDDHYALGAALFDALGHFHSRGVFVREHHIEALLTLFERCRSIEAATFAQLTYTVRDALVAVLDAMPSAHPGWARWSKVLPELESAGVRPLLVKLLNAPLDAPTWSRVVSACARVALLDGTPFPEAEEVVVARLDEDPSACLAALELLATKAGIEALTRRLGLDEDEGTVDEALSPVVNEVLALLWRLSPPESPLRHRLLRRLNPAQLPAAILRDLDVLRRPRGWTAFVSASKGKDVAAHDLLVSLCLMASQRDLPLLRNLLRRHLFDLDSNAVLNEDAEIWNRGQEAVVHPAVLNALDGLGKRWAEQGRLRPRSLASGVDSRGAGEAFVAGLLLDMLRDTSLNSGEVKLVLDALVPLNHEPIVRRIHLLIRHQDRHVRKALLRNLARRRDPRLTFNIARLTEASDVQTARQSFEALAASGASWAEPLLVKGLSHRNMNIKKAAARALLKLGGPRSVPMIIAWLARHDNPGLRATLSSALHRILGVHSTAALVAALETEADPRSQQLLLDALWPALHAKHVRRLAQSQSPCAPLILEALRSRKRLRCGKAREALRLEFERYGIALPTRATSPAPKPKTGKAPDLSLARLDVGWHRESALELLTRTDQPSDRALHRVLTRHLRSWLRLQKGLAPPLRTRTLRWLRSVPSNTWAAHHKVTLRAHLHTFVPRSAPEPSTLATHLTNTLVALCAGLSALERLSLASRVRAWEAFASEDGQARVRVLGACEVLLTRADVLACLEDCRQTSLNAPHTAKLLQSVFKHTAITNPTDKSAGEQLTRALASRKEGVLGELRAQWDTRHDAQQVLGVLFEALPAASEAQRGALLDWILDLQPLDTPVWRLVETLQKAAEDRQKRSARAIEASASISARDMLPSKARLERLLVQLREGDSNERTEAAQWMLAWPDCLEAHGQELLSGYLKGDVLRATWSLARLWETHPTWIDLPTVCEPERVERVFALMQHAAQASQVDQPTRHREWLLDIWASTSIKLARGAQRLLDRVSTATLMPHLLTHLEEGRWQYMRLIEERCGVLDETPRLRSALLVLRKHAPKLASSLSQRTGPGVLRSAETLFEDRHALARVQKLPSRRAFSASEERRALLETLRGGGVEEVHHALKNLSESVDLEVVDAVADLVEHPNPGIRSRAHRVLRTIGDRTLYRRVTRRLLQDPRKDVRLSAMRTLAHARDEAVLVPLIRLLSDRDQQLREEAFEGLMLFGGDALGPLKKARSSARPDRRHVYERALEVIASKEPTHGHR